MVYSDVKKIGLLGIVSPPKSAAGYTKRNKKARLEARAAILNNKPFIQFALKDKQALYINDILGALVEWVIKCNEVYYCS